MGPNTFERRYMVLFWQRQRLQWEDYAAGAAHDLPAVDDAIYRLACANREGRTESGGRREALLQAVARRERVDKPPEVAALRQRLDDWATYASGLTPAQKADRLHYLLTLAGRVKPDVLWLIALRTRLAREEGFSSYVALVLAVEGLSYARLIPSQIPQSPAHNQADLCPGIDATC